MVRHTREDVKRELPTLSKIPYTIDSDPKELEKIKGNATELAKLILAEHSENKGQQFMASEEFSNIMRQATGLAKAPFVADFVKMILDEGQKVVLFGWHRAVYDIWKAALLKYRPLLYTGSETAQEKDKSKKLFTDTEDHNLLIMSLRAGAGTDGLQHVCNTVVFGELDWSPGVIVQDIGRVHRDGQENPVMAYFLLADGGADPIMSEVLGVKRGQIEGVINPASGLVEQLENVGGIRKLAQSYIERKNDES
jgi:SNF2 family DNA or RNA helicase